MIAAVFCVAAATGILRSWQWKLSDALYIGYEPPPDIILVAIDDRSIQAVGRWPWKRSVHADLVRIISEADPRVIGYDVNFPEASEPADDAKLGEAVRSSGKVVLPYELTLVQRGPSLVGVRPLYPIAEISRGCGATGWVRPEPARQICSKPLNEASCASMGAGAATW